MKPANRSEATEPAVSRSAAPNGDVFEMLREAHGERTIIECYVNAREVTPAEFERLARATFPLLEL